MLVLNKPEGITPIDFWKQYRDANLNPKTKGGICGKLDPMATGKLAILLDEECKKMPQFLKMTKTYTFDVIVGISTDTDDILGLLTYQPLCCLSVDSIHRSNQSDLSSDTINQVIQALKDYKAQTTQQQFHNYSAIMVQGRETDTGPLIRRPLWWWSKNGLSHRVQAPIKDVTIHSMDISLPIIISLQDFVNTTLDRLSKVTINPAKFRLPQIINMWQSLKTNLEQNLTPNLILNRIPVTVTVSTGTYYARSLGMLQRLLLYPSYVIVSAERNYTFHQ